MWRGLGYLIKLYNFTNHIDRERCTPKLSVSLLFLYQHFVKTYAESPEMMISNSLPDMPIRVPAVVRN